MKISLRIFRLSRKVVYIITGTLLLSGAAGATALFIGRDKLIGPSQETLNGLECTSVQVTTIHRKDRFWIRKYIKTEAADGLTRVKTALRVAGAVFEKERPDLVQVVVLDANGPEKRADIRGRAIGADVIFVAEPKRMAATAELPQFSATYTDAAPSISGEFFGAKKMVPEEDIHRLLASLSDKMDCLDPLPEPGTEGAAAEGEGEAKPEGGEAAKSEGEGGKPAEHGAAPAEGEEPAAEGEKPAGEGEEATSEGEKPAAEGGEPAESKGWMDSIKSMVMGGGEEAKPEVEGEATAKAETSGEAPVAEAEPSEGEAAPAETPVENAGTEGHASGEEATTPFAPALLPKAGHETKPEGEKTGAPEASAEEQPAEAKPHG